MGTRVALVSGDFRPTRCGVAHYVSRLAEGLAARDVQPAILTSRAALGEAPRVSVHLDERVVGVPVVEAVQRWRIAELPALLRAAARLRPDVVHIQYAPSSYGHSRAITLAPPLLRWLGMPTVVTIHEYGGWDARLRPLPDELVRRLGRLGERGGWWDREALLLATQTDRVIVTNSAHRDLLAGRLRSLNGRLQIVPIGPNVAVWECDQARTRRQARVELGLAETDPLVCFFGFVHPVKGIETLLRAFARLRSAWPGARLLLVGGIESLALRQDEAVRYEGELRTLIAELELGNAVAMTGFLPDAEVSARLQAADVCALPFNPGVNLKSGSLLAALAHGLPTVVTRGEQPAPTLRDGEHVLMVPPRQPEALAEALDRLLRCPALREKLRAGALALAAQHDWSRIVEQHLAIYGELAARPAIGRSLA